MMLRYDSRLFVLINTDSRRHTVWFAKLSVFLRTRTASQGTYWLIRARDLMVLAEPRKVATTKLILRWM